MTSSVMSSCALVLPVRSFGCVALFPGYRVSGKKFPCMGTRLSFACVDIICELLGGISYLIHS